MTWTYSGDPSATARDEVRFLTGDTDTTDQLVTDEEIAYAIAQEANNRGAAVRVARAVAAKFARRSDMSVGDLSYSYSQRAKAYYELADKLELDAALYSAMPYAGGITISGKETVENDSDRAPPAFKRGGMDNPASAADWTDDSDT